MDTKTAQMLQDSANVLRSVTGERDALQTKYAAAQQKLAAYERRVMAEKVAAEMHQKGINTDIDFTSLTASLEKAAAQGKLASIATAVEMVGPNMSIKTASINDDTPTGAGETDIERFLLGSIG